jgi:hypothetical protein
MQRSLQPNIIPILKGTSRSINTLKLIVLGARSRLLGAQPVLRFFHRNPTLQQSENKQNEKNEQEQNEEKPEQEKQEEREDVEEPVRSKVNRRYIEWAFNIVALGLVTVGGIKAYQYFSKEKVHQ